MADSDDQYHLGLRDHIFAELEKELVGPGSADEVLIFDGPRQRYGAGVLFPVRQENENSLLEHDDSNSADPHQTEQMQPEQEKGLGRLRPRSEDDGSGVVDGEINLANEFLPSALGLTVLADVSVGFRVDCDYATYETINSEENGKSRRAWKRKPLPPDSGTVDFGTADLNATQAPKLITRSLPGPDEKGIELRVFVRSPRPGMSKDLRLITVSIVNRAEEDGPGGLDSACIYQCSISLKSEKADGFRSLPDRDSEVLDDSEALSQALLYRKVNTYAVGHGTSPDWGEQTDGGTAHVFTCSLPKYEVPPILPTARPEGSELSMHTLAEADGYLQGGKAYDLCSRLIEDYEVWISDQEREANEIGPEPLAAVAEKHLEICRTCLHRMKRGLELISSDATVRDVFAMMNEAILVQQIRYGQVAENTREWVRDENARLALAGAGPDPMLERESRAWRPFQLAFILMSLSSIVLQDDEAREERNLVDVIWFPTGGGKTEAYLGLTAFTILWRRFKDPRNGQGTAVLMRYTLRLLTAQQFERASTLICALEQLRRTRGIDLLGSKPISIGLWVGEGLSPNKNRDAVAALRKLQSETNAPNRFVLIKCPWCGARMGVVESRRRTIQGLKQERNPSRVELCCGSGDCEFSDRNEGLPIHVVDEQIYEHRPSLLIGTVDKFAMLPWREQSTVGRIFGLDREGPNPPSLVIQDELHLISGPLGSMTGHYETLIDELCRQTDGQFRTGAKIVGSTATISRAAQQVAALYGRPPEYAVLFPPQALEAGNSFFAEVRADLRGRQYAGVFATALPSFVTTEVRVLASLLQAPKLHQFTDISQLDSFWTIVTYFNSIRELGHAATLVDQDIREYLSVIALRLGLFGEKSGQRRWINNPLELTSRISNDQVTDAIAQLFKKTAGKNR